MRPLFRSRYQPQRILHDVMFVLAMLGVVLGTPFAVGVAIGAITHKEPCATYDAKHNIGRDENGKLCRRKA